MLGPVLVWLTASCGPPPMDPLAPQATKLASMRLSLDGALGARPCIHQSPYMQLQVMGKATNGAEVRTTAYYSGGKKRWYSGSLRNDDFEITVSLGALSNQLLFIPPVNDLDLLNTKIVFRAVKLDQPELTAELSIDADFDCLSLVAMRGRDGEQGQPGGNGTDGEDGPMIEVVVTRLLQTATSRRDLAFAKVVNVTSRELLGYYLFSTAHGIRFDVSGGDAGAGGLPFVVESRHHDPLQRGIFSGTATTEANMPGGTSGRSGRGGSVSVQYDSRFPELAEVVRFTKDDGATPVPHMPPSKNPIDASKSFAEELAAGIPIETPKQTTH